MNEKPRPSPSSRGDKALATNRIIYKRAHGQSGLVAAWQLTAEGVHHQAIQRRAQSGFLIRVHRGVYRVGHAPLEQSGKLMAAVLAGGPGAVLSHRSAAAAWGLLEHRGPIHVTRISGSGSAPVGVIRHRTRSLPAGDRALVGNLPVTSIPRTLVDLAGSVPPRVLKDSFSASRRLGLFDAVEVRRAAAKAPNRRGTAGLTALLDRFEPVVAPGESELFDRFHKAVLESGLPNPETEVPIGRYRADMLWPEQMLICEVDGKKWHESRFAEDRERDLELAARGYRTVRVTHAMMLEGIDRLLDMIRGAIDGTHTAVRYGES